MAERLGIQKITYRACPISRHACDSNKVAGLGQWKRWVKISQRPLKFDRNKGKFHGEAEDALCWTFPAKTRRSSNMPRVSRAQYSCNAISMRWRSTQSVSLKTI